MRQAFDGSQVRGEQENGGLIQKLSVGGRVNGSHAGIEVCRGDMSERRGQRGSEGGIGGAARDQEIRTPLREQRLHPSQHGPGSQDRGGVAYFQPQRLRW